MRGRRHIFRCSQGHLFSLSFWGYYGTFRLGLNRYMRCPVGKHWAVARRVSGADLTHEERQALTLRARLDDREAERRTSARCLLTGVPTLVITIVLHTWWALPLAVWVVAWGAVFIRARRVLSTS